MLHLAPVEARDGIYGDYFQDRVRNMSVDEVPTAPRSPWHYPFCERVIGSLRQECLNHVIVLNERHLKRTLGDYLGYYHGCQTHLLLDRNSPEPRDIESPSQGPVTATPTVGGLHHRYTRAA